LRSLNKPYSVVVAAGSRGFEAQDRSAPPVSRQYRGFFATLEVFITGCYTADSSLAWGEDSTGARHSSRVAEADREERSRCLH
jgi:hypothetical protein